ncbi:MAG: hypothetical protein ACMXYE_03515 [Candidatus Woesearchaeota archaeon]
MVILKKIGGIVLLLLSFGILLIFMFSFYNIIFEGGGFDLMANIFTIPLIIFLMVYLFNWGLKILKTDKKEKIVHKPNVVRLHAFLSVSFIFLSSSVFFGLIKIMNILNLNNLYFKISLGLLLIINIIGFYWLYDAIKNKYFDSLFWMDRIIFLKNDFKKSFMNAFGYILGILFIIYFAIAPLISFEDLTPLSMTFDFIATLNIAFHTTWTVFFFFIGKVK